MHCCDLLTPPNRQTDEPGVRLLRKKEEKSRKEFWKIIKILDNKTCL